MRPKILLFCVAVLIGCLLLLFLRRPSKQNDVDANVSSVTSTNQAAANGLPPKNVFNNSNQSSTVALATPPSHPATQQTTNGFIEQIKPVWQVPIDFYGKVVDESNNPVAGAGIQFTWNQSPTEIITGGDDTKTTSSDTDGLFALHGVHGPGLSVQVSKRGYYALRDNPWAFSYSISGHFSPDPLNPIIFHLRKKGQGEPLIHIAGIGLHTMRDFLLAADGKPTEISLLDGRLTPEGQGDLRVEFQAGPPLDNFPSRITWQCQVTVPDGGLVQTDEEFPFLAPENGYQTSDAWSITGTNWTETLNKQYYVKLRNGDFGRVNLRIIGTTRPYFRMESFLNPSGSQNLEPQ
jgi:hypothetical protein